MWLVLLLYSITNEVSGATVYVRQDTSNLTLASLPANLLRQCAQACEQTSDCVGFSVTAAGCQNREVLPQSSPDFILFARTTSPSNMCPAGSKLHDKIPASESPSTTTSTPHHTSSSLSSETMSSRPVATTTMSRQTSSEGQVTTIVNGTSVSTNEVQRSSTSSPSTVTRRPAWNTVPEATMTPKANGGPQSKTNETETSVGTSKPLGSTSTSFAMPTSTLRATSTKILSEETDLTTSPSRTSTVSSETKSNGTSSNMMSTAPAIKLTSHSTVSTTDMRSTYSTGTRAMNSTVSTLPSSSEKQSTMTRSSSSSTAARETTTSTTNRRIILSTTSQTTLTTPLASTPSTTPASAVHTASSPTAKTTPSMTSSIPSTTIMNFATTELSSSSTATTLTTSERTFSPTTTSTTSTPPTAAMDSITYTMETTPSPTSSSSTDTSHVTTSSIPNISTTITESSSSSSTTTTSITTPEMTTPLTTSKPTFTSTTTTTITTPTTTSTTEEPTTTTPNALSNFKFANVPGSNVSCYYETRTHGRFSTNGLCAMKGSDPCKAQGLVSVFGNCAGLSALAIVPDTQCVSTLSYTNTLCVPWEAMYADKENPTNSTAVGEFTNIQTCSTGLTMKNGSGCAPNALGVTMMTGRFTDNLLGFRATDAQEGLMISTCWSYNPGLQLSYCPVSPVYQPNTNCDQRAGYIGWTQTYNACSPNNFYLNMGAAPCGNHSMLISGSGGSLCVGWDVGSVTTPFNNTLSTGSKWFNWTGSTDYANPTGPLLEYEDYMRLPRVLVTPV